MSRCRVFSFNVNFAVLLYQVIHAGIDQLIFSASRDKLIKIWRNSSDEPSLVMSGHTLGVSSIASNKG